jgi:hypothetical protein
VLEFEQLGQLGLHAGLRCLVHAIEERGCFARRTDHHILGEVIRPVRISEDRGHLVADLEHSAQHLEVRWHGAVVELVHERKTRILVTRIVHKRVVIRVARANTHLTVRSGWV